MAASGTVLEDRSYYSDGSRKAMKKETNSNHEEFQNSSVQARRLHMACTERRVKVYSGTAAAQGPAVPVCPYLKDEVNST